MKWSNVDRMRVMLSCIISKTKKYGISTSARNECKAQSNETRKPIKMAYSSYDKSAELSSNIPIIIMHGLLGSRNNWHSLAKVIHKRTRRKVITVDARNHGDSPHTSEMSYPHMVEDIRLLMTDLNIPKSTVIGHSMGGRTMMLFALKYPELVEQLAVVDMSPIGTSPNMEAMPLFFDALLAVNVKPNQPMSSARKEADKQLAANVESRSLRQFFLANLAEKKNGSFGWRMNIHALSKHFKNIASFPEIQSTYNGPTYFIAGEDSDFITPEQHKDILKIFPKALFKYIEDAGHLVHIDQPDVFLDVLCKYLIGK